MRYALVLLTLVGCYDTKKAPPIDPVIPPMPTGEVEGACAAACTNLRVLGCPEGQGSISGASCERGCVAASELRALPLACWSGAADVASAKGCGSLRCIR